MSIRLARRAFATACKAFAATLLAASTAGAQTFPSKTLELVVPYPPGGTNDVIARLVADGLTAELGQPVIILNKAGASAAIGSSFVARAKPDGHTLLLGSQGSHSANPYLMRSLTYDPLKDFTPIAMVGRVNNVLVVPSALPIRSVADFVAYAKKHPGVVNFSHAGVGTSMSLAGELFKLKADVDIVSVPYQGSAAATLAVVSEQVQSMFANIPSVIQHIQSGKLRALGVTGSGVDPLLPDVKPIAQQGVAGYEIQSWFGILAPAGTPQPIVDKLNATIRKVLAQPEALKRFEELGVFTANMTAPQFRSFMQSDNVAIGGLVRQAGLKPQ